MKERREIIFPLTVVFDRYCGVYSHAEWLAFELLPEEVPHAINAGDIECMEFWFENHPLIGRGDTPEEAINDLARRLKAGELL